MTAFGKLIFGLVVVIGLATAGYFVTKPPKDVEVSPSSASQTEATASASTTVPQATTTQTAGKKIPFADFIKKGGAYKCTVNQYVQNVETKGTVYISGGDLRGEFSSTVAGMNFTSTFIRKDDYTYTWTSAMPGKGFKVKTQASAEANTDAKASGTYSWNAEQIGDYNCEVWATDASKFVLPAGVTFSDVN
jgi:hypothetical protein